VAELLRAFLLRSAALPFVWGERDCSLWPAEWIAERRGVDPAASLRGRYDTALGCARLLRREGGLARLASRLAADVGLHETNAPRSGDVACVVMGRHEVLAIRTALRWAGKSPGGITLFSAPVIVAWSI
jgi:hypothetical protein